MISTIIANMKIAIFDREVVTISDGEFDHHELAELVNVVEASLALPMPPGIRQVPAMPEAGQFSAIWSGSDAPWSGTYKWAPDTITTEDTLMVYDAFLNEFLALDGTLKAFFGRSTGDVAFFVGPDE